MAAVEQRNIQRNGRQGGLGRLFVDHPRALGMSWAAHGIGAVRIGAELIGAGLAAIVHAAVPGMFTDTAGRTVARIYDHIQQRKAGAANPDDWPDYEI
ncbi:hypothetical protein H8M03_11910 [Sphingomonas sabuli]|uniref:Capsule biosynthesis protein n=1 Tax=Sphingomonas sabuli TaxID=2764186 RepID=A0A7G9L235_9SPHN|nr:DUF6356 family protein [Sphingomonas sabuli]QNM82684.1 hypothetical protein H8M03_11910 [Sphingomonas sabuli]